MDQTPPFLAIAEDFKREDLARAVVHLVGYQIAMTAAHAAQMTRTPHVFMAGSLMAEPLIQEVVARQFDVRRWNNAAGVDDMVNNKIPCLWSSGPMMTHECSGRLTFKTGLSMLRR